MGIRITSFAALLLLSTSPALADTGHVGLSAGALSLEEGNRTEWRPYARTELGIRVWGPIEIGAQLQVAATGFPAELASFGGGFFLELRPEENLFGFVPHAEIGGSRVTLPTSSGRYDAWELRVGGGLGYEVGSGFVLEARLQHRWYFDLPEDSGVGVDSWTVSFGLTYRLP